MKMLKQQSVEKRFLASLSKMSFSPEIFFFLFNCYLAAPRQTLGHTEGNSLTNPMLITAF